MPTCPQPPHPPAAPAATMPAAVGLAGPGGVGKSTTARALAASMPFVVVPISTPIKAMMQALYEAFGVDGETIRRKLDGDLKRVPCAVLGGRTPTYAMQTLGTEWGRNLIATDLWVRWWRREAADCVAAGLVPVNDSVRFAEEADAVHELGGVVVGLAGRGDLAADHASEHGVPADATVTVAGAPADVAAAVLAVALTTIGGSAGNLGED
ncbi:P-loop NTPase family protein [Acuticoccus mangrovi]|uniref:Uncharacterized protein n=1 Tax=Acuticoccus mangrovi TaxID=2796142 RepID=A0A934MLJ0_9HYPH|nr:hypothetical protein [Acuticoccus mangrovi]MBJ3776414.1 hypothetical protein [Acuticoccus mangrovi]